MDLHVFEHVAFEGPGRIADWARSRQHNLATTRFHRNESPPDPDEVEGLIVMGGPMNIYQTDQFPWLRTERHFISRFVATGKPVLGICLGAQLLADALGSPVFPHRSREIGWMPVEFTDGGLERFPFLPASMSVLHWHGDTYRLPRGARRLAWSQHCVEQGFLWEDNVLALQFHLEAGEGECGLLLEHCGEELSDSGPTVHTAEQICSGAQSHAELAGKALHSLLDSFFMSKHAAFTRVACH